MSPVVVALVVGGLLALLVGGEVLVRGAGGLAAALGLSPLVVGLTVVAFATSTPEMAVTVGAALGGSPGLGLGNVVGSNVVNVLLVLGATAVLAPIAVGARVVRSDLPVLVAVSLLTLLLALDGVVSRTDGALLLACAVGSTTLAVLLARRGRRPDAVPPDRPGRPGGRRLWRDVLLVAVGVALLVVGARWLVSGASEVARSLGVDDVVVGLTVVAVGTSLPELVTSVVASLRGQREMALGNVTGSCILNLGAVLGAAAVLAPQGVPVPRSTVEVDLPFMVAVTLVLLPVAVTGAAISRWEGAALLGCWAAYTTYLLLGASGSTAVGPGAALLLLVAPVTALGVGPLLAARVRRRRRPVAGGRGPRL